MLISLFAVPRSVRRIGYRFAQTPLVQFVVNLMWIYCTTFEFLTVFLAKITYSLR